MIVSTFTFEDILSALYILLPHISYVIYCIHMLAWTHGGLGEVVLHILKNTGVCADMFLVTFILKAALNVLETT